MIRKLGIPVTTAWTAHDTIASADPLYCGRPGTIGDRPGNFAVQNADTLLVIGSRLNIRQVSYNWKSFAKHAYKLGRCLSGRTRQADSKARIAYLLYAKVFLDVMEEHLDGFDTSKHSDWLNWCKKRVERYPVVLPKHRLKKTDS